jgi:hypothetical protein
MTDSQNVEPIRRWLHRVTASGGVHPKTLISHLTACVAIDPRLRPGDFVGLDRSRETKRSRHRIDGENCFLLL